jgi:C1A family cysteine protease
MLSLFSLGFSPKQDDVDYSSLFSAWKKHHGKSYHTADAEVKAFKTFSAHEDTIRLTNAKGLSYKLGHNEFSDLTWHEFFRGGLAGERKRSHLQHVAVAGEALPNSVDWVTAGAVTAVKNQGQCGSCWSFSTTGAIEGAFAIAGNPLTSLSEEDLVQCDTTDSGCNGGLMDRAFEWVSENGVALESAYPYTSGTGTRGTCDAVLRDAPAVTVTGKIDVVEDDEDALKSAVAMTPVSVAIEADQSVFQLYSSGVLDSTSCGTQLDHGVLVVGYGTDSTLGKDYWKVKNSWGTTWGEEGYIRMVRGSNMCGIASQPSYPTGAKQYEASAAVKK